MLVLLWLLKGYVPTHPSLDFGTATLLAPFWLISGVSRPGNSKAEFTSCINAHLIDAIAYNV